MIKLIENKTKHVSRVIVSFLLLALFLSFITYNPYESALTIDHLPKSCEQLNKPNSKLSSLNYNISKEDNSKLGLRREEGAKQKKFFCSALALSAVVNISCSLKSFTVPEYFLFKPFQSLEILSSRNHPPTFYLVNK